MTKYVLTEAHKAQFPAWRDKWIANALQTGPYDDDDKAACRVAVRGLYDAADLAAPTNEVFAAGPISAAFAASIASGVWWLRDNPGCCPGVRGTVTEEMLQRAWRRAVRVVCGVESPAETINLLGLNGSTET